MGRIADIVGNLPHLLCEEERRRRVVARVAEDAASLLERGRSQMMVRGGILNLPATTYPKEVYAEVDNVLGEKAAIEAHRYRAVGQAVMPTVEPFMQSSMDVPMVYDRIRIVPTGEEVANESWCYGPENDPDYAEQVYP